MVWKGGPYYIGQYRNIAYGDANGDGNIDKEEEKVSRQFALGYGIAVLTVALPGLLQKSQRLA